MYNLTLEEHPDQRILDPSHVGIPFIPLSSHFILLLTTMHIL